MYGYDAYNSPIQAFYLSKHIFLCLTSKMLYVSSRIVCIDIHVLRIMYHRIKKNGNIRYADKNACKHCKNRSKCYKGKNEWREIGFTKDQLQKPCKDWLKENGKEPGETKTKETWNYEKVKVVKFNLKPDRKKTSQRMCLSEHPVGTIKRAMGATYFLIKGIAESGRGICALLSGI